MRDPVDAVFSALADPNRRFVLETLASRGTATPTELAAGLPVTRQAVTKHLTALRDAGLVEATRSGRETRYALTPEPLASATEWLEEVGAAWDDRLKALRRLAQPDQGLVPASRAKGRGHGDPEVPGFRITRSVRKTSP